MPHKQIDFVYFDAGGGHRAAATALCEVIAQQGLPWQTRMVNFQEVLDEIDVIRKVTGLRLQDVYNLMLKKGWTLGSPQLTVAMHLLIRMIHPQQVRVLKKFWAKSTPDLVVSVIPNFSRALFQSLRAVHPRTPLVTILTDLADYPPRFWMEPQLDQHWICGTDKAVQQARAMNYASERIHRVSGMILNPRFYQPVEVDRAGERTRHGLRADLPTGLLLFGGQGSAVMYRILERVEECGVEAQFIVICGKNRALREKIAARQWRIPVLVEGFTSEIPYYMRLSDFLIGKPGPGSLSEAMHMHLPAIIERSAWTLPQERYNAEWLREQETGIVLDNFREIGAAVKQLLSGGTLERMRANAQKLQNRAVFEILTILEQLMA